MNIINFLVMVLVGAISGTLAARIMRGGDHFGFFVNALLGIVGAVVAGFIFNFFGMTPGAAIVSSISETFGVNLPVNIVGMFVSSTLGAILILWVISYLKRGRRRSRRR